MGNSDESHLGLRRHVKQAILKLVEHEIDEWFFKLGLGKDPHG